MTPEEKAERAVQRAVVAAEAAVQRMLEAADGARTHLQTLEGRTAEPVTVGMLLETAQAMAAWIDAASHAAAANNAAVAARAMSLDSRRP